MGSFRLLTLALCFGLLRIVSGAPDVILTVHEAADCLLRFRMYPCADVFFPMT